MKNIIFIIALLTICLKLSAQTPPVVKVGSILQYNFELHGQHAAFQLQIARAVDTLVLEWKIRGLAGGTYLISPSAFQNGSKLSFAQPQPFTKVKLAGDETFCMISKKAFKDLKAGHKFVYDNTNYDLKDDGKENPLMLGAQRLNVIHVTAENETTEFWILDNPDFPFICQIKNNPLGINYVLNNITESN